MMTNSIYTSEIGRRIFAGIWFALAAVIPVGYFFALDPFNGGGLPILRGSVVLTAVVPIFVSGICGLALGADILNDDEIKTVLPAVGRGLAVGLLSYLVLFVGGTVVLASTGEGSFVGLIVTMIFFFLYSLLFIGWLVALVGAAAGGLLYLLRLKTFGREQ